MNSKDKVEEILSQIESDKENGATYLAGRGLDVLEIFATSLEGDAQAAESSLQDLVKRISSIRPSMGAIRTQAMLAYRRAEELVEKGISLPKALESAVAEERKKLEEADQIIAEIAFEEMGSGGTIVTCSSSGTVKTVVQKLRPASILIGEGYPLGDGARAARWFVQEGFDVKIVSDADLPTIVKGTRAVLVGADQVLADGSVVNRSSTLSLALSAQHFRVPFYVACQRIKFSGQNDVTIEEYTSNSVIETGVPTGIPLFDVTPPELIRKILTEIGAMTPSQAGKVG